MLWRDVEVTRAPNDQAVSHSADGKGIPSTSCPLSQQCIEPSIEAVACGSHDGCRPNPFVIGGLTQWLAMRFSNRLEGYPAARECWCLHHGRLPNVGFPLTLDCVGHGGYIGAGSCARGTGSMARASCESWYQAGGRSRKGA